MRLSGELILSAALLLCMASNAASVQGQQRVSSEAPVVLSFKEFFVLKNGELTPAPRLLALNGKRVRLVGFMAQLESPTLGGFYLCPRPIICDEEGAGTADLPLENVLVIVRSMSGKEIPFNPRALEVAGILEVGNHQGSDGRISFVRLILDRPADASADDRQRTNQPKQ